jgi:cytochrome b6-f complex iron-sulfur subunit
MSEEDKGADKAAAMTRRRALTVTSVVGLAGACGVAGVSNLLFFKPRVTYGEPSRFRIGKPESFPLGTRLPLGRQRVTIVRNEQGICAISNTCTHLGCVIATTEIGFDCPCHGSRVDPEGSVLGGPAPRPLPWFALSLSPAGEVEVDTASEVPQGTYLKV